MRAPFRSNRSAIGDLPLRLLAGVALAAIVLTTASAASDAARASSHERAARQALQAFGAAVESVHFRPGSRVHFTIDSASLPPEAELVIERLVGQPPSMVATLRGEGRSLARSLLCTNCTMEWNESARPMFVAGAGTEMVLSSSSSGTLRVEVFHP